MWKHVSSAAAGAVTMAAEDKSYGCYSYTEIGLEQCVRQSIRLGALKIEIKQYSTQHSTLGYLLFLIQ